MFTLSCYHFGMLLYIHIPFCDSKCHYCSFNSYVDKFHLKKSYMKALVRQLQHELERFEATKSSIQTLFIGGGTPSTVSPQLYAPLFELIVPYMKADAEMTTEANPNSASQSWLEGMYGLGVNRVSFGVQSFDETKLRLLNRAHSPQQAKEAVLSARECGFENISLDLIYGVAGDTKELLEHDIDEAFSLPINHLSAYALTIEEGTVFQNTPQMSQERLAHTRWFFDEIKQRGFSHYEISNFGTYKSRHNLGYWQYMDYMGVGSGAVGKLGDRRFYPTRNIEAYISDPLQRDVESLSQEDMRFERIFLGLRSEVGVAAELLKKKEREGAQVLCEEGKLFFQNGRYYNRDFLLADEIALFLSNF